VCLPGASDGKNVRLQETREEENKETERGSHGYHRKTNFAENKLEFCGMY